MKWETPKERLEVYGEEDRQKLRQRFETWKASLDALSSELLTYVPYELAAKLDFSVASLLPLEAWLLETFDDHHKLMAHRNGRTMEVLHAYLAQTLVPVAKGRLDICLDEGDFDFAVPIIVLPKGFSIHHSSIGSYPTMAVHRRKGTMIYDLARKWEELAAKDSSPRAQEDVSPVADKFDAMLDAAVAEEEARIAKRQG